MNNAGPQVDDPLLKPFQLRHLELRNRIISTAHAPALAENGHPKDRYRLYHEEKAKGGVALTIIGGSSNVSPDSPSVFGQLNASDDSIVPWFEKLTEGVKTHGAAVMCQLTHMGRRTSWDGGDWLPVIGASKRREQAHRSIPKIADAADLTRVTKDFAAAARRCKIAGFDGIEILSHAHLLGQFLSPAINDRSDSYGGSLENRLRLTMEVLDAVRGSVGSDFIVGLRMTGDEELYGGLQPDDCIEVAKHLQASGLVDFLNILNGAPYDDLGLAGWVPPMGHPTARGLRVAHKIRQAVTLPIFQAGGINDLATARHALKDGLVDMIGMTRAQIADPYLVKKMTAGEEQLVRPCVGLGYCVDRVNQGKDAVCGHNAATGREARLSHNPRPIPNAGKVAVIGGGPAGLEAARVAALRGHQVHLFEAAPRLGGQLILASQGTIRRQIGGVLDWLTHEVDRLGVKLHMNTYVDGSDFEMFSPDLVVVATGGLPMPLEVMNSNLAVSSWDVLSGNTRAIGRTLIWDQIGNHPAAVLADVLSAQSQELLFATCDAEPFKELGPTTQSTTKKHLYSRSVQFLPDHEILEIDLINGRKRVLLRNLLTQDEREEIVDDLVVETGTEVITDPFDQLLSNSKNLGILEIGQFSKGKLCLPNTNPSGRYHLVRIGDAVASRNIHAAIYDANRVLQAWSGPGIS